MAFFGGLAVNLVFERLAWSIERVALHARRIRIRLVQLRRPMSRGAPIVGIIIPDMLHAADLREHRTEHPIIGVANVTALIAEIRVFAMNGCQRRAVGIRSVIGMHGHGMARSAEFAFRRDLEIGHVAGHCRGDG